MRRGWLARLFFALVAAMAVAGVISGTACTRWGQPGPVTPTIAPLSSIYVDPTTGSDTSGNGSSTSPYKTLTKAVTVLTSSKVLSPSGVTIYLSNGDYVAANGEKFPIVIPTGVTINGTNYGAGPTSGTFINGFGEDTLFEQLVHAPPHTAYTTLEVVPPGSVSLSDVYVGASKISLPSSQAFYDSLDDIGTVSAATSTFAAGIVSSLRNINGVFVPGGSFTCSSCAVHGNDIGIAAFSVPIATMQPSPVPPSITLNRPGTALSLLAAKVVDILTDGSANIDVSGSTFEQADYAYTDAFTPIVLTTVRGGIDFGGGVASSTGGNTFIGARLSELFVIRRYETIAAYGDTWNPNQQGANGSGLYPAMHVFGSGVAGRNVTIRDDALGSTVSVGPPPVPTPTPSVSPSISPTASPT